VHYVLNVQNLRPGGGEAVGPNACRFTTWANSEASQTSGLGSTKSWMNDLNIIGTAGPDGKYGTSDYTNALNQFAGTGYHLIPQNADISQVEAIFSLYVGGVFLSNDTVGGALYFNNDSTPIASLTFPTASINNLGLGSSEQDLLVWDVTSARGWTWSDFSGNLDLLAQTTKVGGKDGSIIYLDAIGFRVTTNSACPIADPDDILNTVPVTDTYDADLLTFVTAQPPVSSHNPSSGLLTWDDIGPIYPGQSKDIFAHLPRQATEP
jgi:hypothetical protein